MEKNSCCDSFSSGIHTTALLFLLDQMFQTQHAGVITGFLSCYFYSSFDAITKHDARAGLSNKDLQPQTFLGCRRLHPLVWLEALKKEMYT